MCVSFVYIVESATMYTGDIVYTDGHGVVPNATSYPLEWHILGQK